MIKIPQITFPDLSHLQIDFDKINRVHQEAINSVDWDVVNRTAEEATRVAGPIMERMRKETERTNRMMAPIPEQMKKEEERVLAMMKAMQPTFLGFDVVESEEDFVERVTASRPKEEKTGEKPRSIFSASKLESWNGLAIKFADNEHVEITIPGDRFSYKVHYKQFGFEDRRKRAPDKNWKFLLGISMTGGQVTWADKTLSSDYVKKRKQFVKNKLMDFFDLDEDPFYKYTKKEGYRVKFVLLPMDKPYGL